MLAGVRVYVPLLHAPTPHDYIHVTVKSAPFSFPCALVPRARVYHQRNTQASLSATGAYLLDFGTYAANDTLFAEKLEGALEYVNASRVSLGLKSRKSNYTEADLQMRFGTAARLGLSNLQIWVNQVGTATRAAHRRTTATLRKQQQPQHIADGELVLLREPRNVRSNKKN